MSASKTNPKLTKAGIALSADARAKLQRLADWMCEELKGQQDPRVKLSLLGTVVNYEGVTHVSPIGALVQMHAPFKLHESRHLLVGLYRADAAERVPEILGISKDDYVLLVRYMHAGYGWCDVISALRTLK